MPQPSPPALRFALLFAVLSLPLSASPESRPYGTALDDDGMLWIAETGAFPMRLVGFDTAAERFVAASTLPEGGSVRHCHYDAGSDAIWFGVDGGLLARARVRGSDD